jgi:hypothetical protein
MHKRGDYAFSIESSPKSEDVDMDSPLLTHATTE